MGGYGSGRNASQGKTSQYRSLDVNHLAKAGALRPGNSIGWQWSADGMQLASIQTKAEVRKLVLTYRIREPDGNWQPITEHIAIEEVPCAFGGSRPYFRCPGVVNGRHCGRRVGKLYGARYFVCRHCLRLAYPVQSEGAHYRMLRRANKRRATLGGDPGTCSGITKPKGMHWRTFDKIVDEIESAEASADAEFSFWVSRRFPGPASNP